MRDGPPGLRRAHEGQVHHRLRAPEEVAVLLHPLQPGEVSHLQPLHRAPRPIPVAVVHQAQREALPKRRQDVARDVPRGAGHQHRAHRYLLFPYRLPDPDPLGEEFFTGNEVPRPPFERRSSCPGAPGASRRGRAAGESSVGRRPAGRAMIPPGGISPLGGSVSSRPGEESRAGWAPHPQRREQTPSPPPRRRHPPPPLRRPPSPQPLPGPGAPQVPERPGRQGRRGAWEHYRGALTSADFLFAVLTALLTLASWLLFLAGGPPAVVAGLGIAGALAGGIPIAVGALRGLLAREMNVDELVTIAIGASIYVGEYWGAALVAFMMLFGKVLEDVTAARAEQALEGLGQLVPATAQVLDAAQPGDQGGQGGRGRGSGRCRWGTCAPGTSSWCGPASGSPWTGGSSPAGRRSRRPRSPGSRSRLRRARVRKCSPGPWPRVGPCRCPPPAPGRAPPWGESPPWSRRRRRSGPPSCAPPTAGRAGSPRPCWPWPGWSGWSPASPSRRSPCWWWPAPVPWCWPRRRPSSPASPGGPAAAS